MKFDKFLSSSSFEFDRTQSSFDQHQSRERVFLLSYYVHGVSKRAGHLDQANFRITVTSTAIHDTVCLYKQVNNNLSCWFDLAGGRAVDR